jgi:hypothetical protein
MGAIKGKGREKCVDLRSENTNCQMHFQLTHTFLTRHSNN